VTRGGYQKLVRIGGIVLAAKVVLVALIVLAMFCKGLPRVQALWLGAHVLPVNDTIRAQFGVSRKGGVLINRVFERSPAEEARLRRGDVILNVDNRPVYAADDIRRVLRDRRYNDSVRTVYVRDGAVFSTKVVLDYRPSRASAVAARSAFRYELTLADFFVLLLLGILAGTLNGMTACGGAILKVSLLIIFFGFDIYLAKVISLVSSGFMSLSSSQYYTRRGLVDREALRYLIPSGIIGVLGGVAVSMLLSRHVLEAALGIFLLYAALDVAYQIYAERREGATATGPDPEGAGGRRRHPSILLLAGFPTGFCSAMLGITGGVVETPLHRYLTRAPIKTCIANTLVTLVFVCFLGGGLLLVEGLLRDYFSFGTFARVLLAIVPGSIIGGQIGGRLNHVLPADYVKGIYAVAALFIAYQLLAPA